MRQQGNAEVLGQRCESETLPPLENCEGMVMATTFCGAERLHREGQRERGVNAAR